MRKDMRARWPDDTAKIVGSQHQKKGNILEGCLTLVFSALVGFIIFNILL